MQGKASWATDATAETGTATMWASERPGWALEVALTDTGEEFLGVVMPTPAPDDFAFHVTPTTGGQFAAVDDAGGEIGVFATLRAALDAGAAYAEAEALENA